MFYYANIFTTTWSWNEESESGQFVCKCVFFTNFFQISLIRNAVLLEHSIHQISLKNKCIHSVPTKI